jgi:prepilin-type N-terminal cleavage/methylation domain-containing protein
MFKKGFTISELMIALAIIACIAAMLIPYIVKNRPNKEKAMFRKAYYIVERVVSELINNDELYPSDMDERQGFSYYDSENSDSNDTGKTFCNEFAKKVNTTGDVNCDAAHILSDDNTTPTFTTTDGVDWYFVTNNFCDPDYVDDKATCQYPDSSTPACPTQASDVSPYTCIYLDINGSAAPNSFTINDGSPADRFKIYIYYNGKVQIESDSPAAEYLKSETIF